MAHNHTDTGMMCMTQSIRAPIKKYNYIFAICLHVYVCVSQCLVVSVNECFKDPRIWQGTSAPIFGAFMQ